MSRKTLQTMLDWVEDHLETEAGLEDMARYVRYSPLYCSGCFHRFTGVSFKEYLLNRRMDAAAHRLLSSDENILEIAVRFGFSSQAAFTRAFRKTYGLPPGRFRSKKPSFPSFDIIRIDCATERNLPYDKE